MAGRAAREAVPYRGSPGISAKASPEPLWFGAFLSLATAYGCFISTLERRYGLFLQLPVGGSYNQNLSSVIA